ncbi:hypothetical protein KFJ24_00335 [Marinobacter sediminum]|uniref:hypothetical protein n=1 Tax=Marinobacter sediminum TaxID=256323 RepID=UPI002030D2D6|nr:hypothetical protein [Marinobacter sediminum]MCM0610920.1 hypothetical protein [Marinobacter sediminum]
MSKHTVPLNVFVASTPLQLMSCTEARHAYGCPADTCLLVIARPDNRETESQMAFLAEALGWHGVETIYLKKSTFYFRLGYISRSLSGRVIHRLFIGNKSSWIHEIFYRGLDSEQLIFVDDGLATVKYYHAIHDEGIASRISREKSRLLAVMGIHLHRIAPEVIAFFTCFPLASSERVQVRVHDFPVFRETFALSARKKGGEPLVGFLGQPIGGESRPQQLRDQMAHVVERHPETRIVYFMHRKESRTELERILAGFPVEIRQAGRPIEVEVALSGEAYIAFYSFVSTALFTLKKIFPDMQMCQIDDQVLSVRIPFYDKIVSMFREIGVETTTL